MIGRYDHKFIESTARNRWRKIDLLKKINEKNKDGKTYFLLDGPPYANNIPHVGHIRNTIYKDFFIRQAMMKGKNVLFQPGFDTHGLPIENMVEKKLGFKSKKDIVSFGKSKFCEECKASAIVYKDVWLRTYDKLGSWYSWKEPYITFENNYIESVWWSFKKMWDKNMVYEGKKPVFWCPSCETALAGYESTDSYAQKEDPLIIVKFKVKDTADDHLLVFTTTPWTLPGNIGIAVKGEADYVKVKTSKGNLILAKNLLKLLKDIELEYEILEEFKGEKLDGVRYEPILDVPSQKELEKNPKALRVYLSIPILKERVNAKVAAKLGIKSGDVFEDFVSVNDGTGLVHIGVGHGKTDNLVGIHYGLPAVSPLDDQCKFTEEAGKYKGKFVKDADNDIIEDLKKENKMLYNHKISHSYPLCWRCKSPLIFRMSNQWFLKTDSIKDEMLKANEKILWQPEFAGERFQDWVANAEDWNFSRQRFWGIPIPIFKSEDKEYKVFGSKEELEKEAGKLGDDFDLHTIGDIKLKSKSGKEMKAIGDIFDVWYDSGSAPFAAFHYPFENKELFEKHYPVDRINEAQDQVRGWFYSLMFVGIGALDNVPYKAISMPAWVVDKNGEKMSKSLGNFLGAEEAMDSLGADNVRFYYCWDVDPSALARFNEDTVKIEVSRIHNTLWNLHKLIINEFLSQKEEDKNFTLTSIEKIDLKIEDKWLLSRLNTTIENVLKYFDNFGLHFAGREIYEFTINDLSRTYVQLVRDRLEEDSSPLSLINHALMQIIKILAPISPHVTDEIYFNLNKSFNDSSSKYEYFDSVHLDTLPAPNNKMIDKKLEAEFLVAMNLVGSVLAARDKVQIGIRWPIKKIIVDTDKDSMQTIKSMNEVILNATNAKEIEFKKLDVQIDFKLRYKEIASDFGEKTSDVAGFINKNKDKISKLLQTNKEITLEDYTLKPSYFEISKLPIKGYSMGEFKQGLVFIKDVLEDDLLPEGFVREIIRRIQVLRKDMNLTKQDRINLVLEVGSDLEKYVNEHIEFLKSKVGANTLEFKNIDSTFENVKEDKVKSKSFRIAAKKI